MIDRGTIDNWLQLFGSKSGIDLSLNDAGVCSLFCEEKIPIAIMAEAPKVHLYAELAELPMDINMDIGLLIKAMELNQFQYMTGGANLTLGGTGFMAIMDSFLNKCKELKDRLDEEGESQSRDDQIPNWGLRA